MPSMNIQIASLAFIHFKKVCMVERKFPFEIGARTAVFPSYSFDNFVKALNWIRRDKVKEEFVLEF